MYSLVGHLEEPKLLKGSCRICRLCLICLGNTKEPVLLGKAAVEIACNLQFTTVCWWVVPVIALIPCIYPLETVEGLACQCIFICPGKGSSLQENLYCKPERTKTLSIG